MYFHSIIKSSFLTCWRSRCIIGKAIEFNLSNLFQLLDRQIGDSGDRYLPPGNALEQERIMRGREKLIRRSLQDQLEQERLESAARFEQERLESAARLEQEHRSLALKMIQEDIPLETIARITNLTIEQLKQIR